MMTDDGTVQKIRMSAEDAHQRLRDCEIHIRNSEYEGAERIATSFLDDALYPAAVVGRAYLDIAEVRWRTGYYTEAIDLALQAVKYIPTSGEPRLQSRAHSVLGIAYKHLGNFEYAIESFSVALEIDEKVGYDKGVGINLSNVGSVYHEMKDYERAFEYYHKAVAVNEKVGNTAGLSIAIGNIGDLYLATHQYANALSYGMRCLTLDQEMGSIARLGKQYSSIGLAYMGLGEYDNALDNFHKSIEAFEREANYADSAVDYGNIGLLYTKKDTPFYNPSQAEEYLRRAITIAERYDIKPVEAEYLLSLASLLAEQSRWQEAYTLHLRYHELRMALSKSEAHLAALRFDYQHKAAERDKQLAVERARHEITKQLLHNVLPPSIAHRMVEGENLIAEKLNQVTVLFADIVNFTQLSQSITPEELVQGLDRIFSEFDILAEKYNLEKIKTIGDSYMVVAGAPEPRPDHSQVMTQMAMDMLEAMKKFTSTTTGEQIHIRIGIHSGEVVAGVIGKKKFAYDLWGDAVNTAARMESHGEAGRIHVSEDFVHVLTTNSEQQTIDHDDRTLFTLSSSLFTATPRGEIDIKGKGLMRTYFLEKA